MMTAFKNWLVAPLAVSIFAGLTAFASAQIISFEYTQTDKNTGSGTLSGRVDGVEYTGVMPQATVTQVDENNLPLPDGYIGYMDGWQESQPGNPFGVHLGWSGEVTLSGQKVISPTTLQLFELDLPLILDQAGDAEWRYEFAGHSGPEGHEGVIRLVVGAKSKTDGVSQKVAVGNHGTCNFIGFQVLAAAKPQLG